MSPLCQGQFEDLHCQSQILEKMNYPVTTKGEDYHELETARKAQLKFAAIHPWAKCLLQKILLEFGNMQLHGEAICHYIRLAWSVLDGEPKRLK